MMTKAQIFVESNSAQRDEHSRNYKCISTVNALKALEIQKQDDLGIKSNSKHNEFHNLLELCNEQMTNMLSICQTSVECENCPMHNGGRCSFKQVLEEVKQTLNK